MTEVNESHAGTHDSRKKHLTFKLNDENYGIDINYVTEIVGMQDIIEIPESPGYVIGIINLRGEIIPLIDAKVRFGKTFESYSERTCIIVIRLNNLVMGLAVDGVSEVLSFEDDAIAHPPEVAENRYINGIGKYEENIFLLLDCDILFGNDDSIKKIN